MFRVVLKLKAGILKDAMVSPEVADALTFDIKRRCQELESILKMPEEFVHWFEEIRDDGTEEEEKGEMNG